MNDFSKGALVAALVFVLVGGGMTSMSSSAGVAESWAVGVVSSFVVLMVWLLVKEIMDTQNSKESDKES